MARWATGRVAMGRMATGRVATEDSAGRPLGIRGSATRGISIANLLPTRTADLVVTSLGALPPVDPQVVESVPPCSVADFGLAQGEGSAGFLVESSDEPPVGGLMRGEWSHSGGTVLGRAPVPATNLVLALVVKRYCDQTSSPS